MALQLRKHGIRRVRPLLGGYYEWKQLGYPLVSTLPPDQQGDAESSLQVRESA